MAESLRDQLAANFDKIVTVDAPVVDAPEPIEPAAPAAPPSSRIQEAPKAAPRAAPAAKAAPAPTDDRPRDPETGQFVPKADAPPAKEVPSAAKIHPAKQALPGTPQAEAALSQVPAKPRRPPRPQFGEYWGWNKGERPDRPQAWRKEYSDKWEQLDPDLAQYIHEREWQYQTGVSTYKAEAENAKPIMEAMQQFMPELQQHNVNPQRWITELGNVHRMLAFGSPQQKLATLANVARAYGVPLQAYSDQNAQQQFLSQPAQAYQPPQNPQQAPLTRDDAMRLWQEQFVQVNADQDLQRFSADAENHPHYDEVRATMAGLLQANLEDINDLESAYQAALRMPQHAHLYEAMQEQQRQAQEEQRRQAEAQRVLKAKGKAVSPASATPSGPGSEKKPKGLRSAIEQSFDAVVGGGRV